jgi:RNA polymerase sigma-70 factor (TIGR02960 family)
MAELGPAKPQGTSRSSSTLFAGFGVHSSTMARPNRSRYAALTDYHAAMSSEVDLLAAARSGDEAAFARLVSAHRRGLLTHCYRVLGSPVDAEDALQESLLAAWRGLAGFEGRSSLRTWLYQVSTHAALRIAEQRSTRLLSPDRAPPRQSTSDLGEPVAGPVWLEPLSDDFGGEVGEAADPSARYLARETVELAFVAALQHLPATQRAVLLLCDVIELSAAEAAQALGISIAAVNSALQRARKAVEERVPPRSQQAELRALGEERQRALLEAFVSAWERRDTPALLALLTEDVRFTMPPLPAWYAGATDVGRFFAERIFATPWRLVPVAANGQLGFACYIRQPGRERFELGAVNVLSLRGDRIAWIAAFLDPAAVASFRVPAVLA